MKENPYTLIWFHYKMSEKQIAANNKKFWDWEIKHNGFDPSHSPIKRVNP